MNTIIIYTSGGHVFTDHSWPFSHAETTTRIEDAHHSGGSFCKFHLNRVTIDAKSIVAFEVFDLSIK